MAYTRQQILTLLGLVHPLDFEAKQGIGAKRRTGQTTRMLVEATTDVLNGKSVTVVGHNLSFGKDMAQQVKDWVTQIDPSPLFVQEEMVQGISHRTFLNRTIQPSDAIHVDHYQEDGDHRLLGPAGEVRLINEVGDDLYKAYDYDGNYLLDLDEDGKNQIIEERSLGVRYIPLPTSAPRPLPKAPANSLMTVRAKSTGMVNTKMGVAPREIDGVYIRNGDTVLLTDQPVPTKNGLYLAVGNSRGRLGLNRRNDPAPGSMALVSNGKLHSNSIWAFDGSCWHQVTVSSHTPAPSQKDVDIDTLIADISYTSPPSKKVIVSSTPESSEEDRKALADLLEDLLK